MFQAFNILRYEVGQRYNSHYDAFNPAEYGPQKSQRVKLINNTDIYLTMINSLSFDMLDIIDANIELPTTYVYSQIITRSQKINDDSWTIQCIARVGCEIQQIYGVLWKRWITFLHLKHIVLDSTWTLKYLPTIYHYFPLWHFQPYGKFHMDSQACQPVFDYNHLMAMLWSLPKQSFQRGKRKGR